MPEGTSKSSAQDSSQEEIRLPHEEVSSNTSTTRNMRRYDSFDIESHRVHLGRRGHGSKACP
ncbi:hypothetical protein TIFTF001_007324 [Ficus carica]|uniref:Uncharacterized protein n=1 Tax=Ficus carica TaxID=3494 RepID=A0AA88AD68_FICCA|nr:hypothetical protein TIFTF001_007324 [Ficus carica]